MNMLVGVGVGLVRCQALTGAEATVPLVGRTGSLAMKPVRLHYPEASAGLLAGEARAQGDQL